MKKSEFRSLIREEIKKVLKEGYLEQNNLDVAEFHSLSPADYKTLEMLIKKHDDMIEKNDALFDMTNDFVSPDSFSSVDGYKEYYEQVKNNAKGDLAKIATGVLQLLNRIKPTKMNEAKAPKSGMTITDDDLVDGGYFKDDEDATYWLELFTDDPYYSSDDEDRLKMANDWLKKNGYKFQMADIVDIDEDEGKITWKIK